MAFQNHRIFSIRCLKEDLVPVSAKLKSNIWTPKARIITKKVERALLNERIRSINNTIAMATSERDTCMNTLLGIFSREIIEECAKFLNLRKEAYYIKVENRQKTKLEWLCHKSRGGHPNIQHGGHGRQELNDTSSSGRNTKTTGENTEEVPDIKERWVVNLSGQPLTEAETTLLMHRPNFAVTSRSPPS